MYESDEIINIAAQNPRNTPVYPLLTFTQSMINPFISAICFMKIDLKSTEVLQHFSVTLAADELNGTHYSLTKECRFGLHSLSHGKK